LSEQDALHAPGPQCPPLTNRPAGGQQLSCLEIRPLRPAASRTDRLCRDILGAYRIPIPPIALMKLGYSNSRAAVFNQKKVGIPGEFVQRALLGSLIAHDATITANASHS